jgi:hypothetical protein
MVAKLVVGVRGLNASQLVDKARLVVERMTDNPRFTDPTPKLSDVTLAKEELEVAITDALDGGRKAVATRRIRQRALKLILEQLGGYVVATVGDDEEAILSTGFTVRRQPSPVGEVTTPIALQASMSPIQGRVDIRWKAVRYARLYTVFVNSAAPEQADGWRQLGNSSKASFKATGLASGKVHWFRVCAIGTAGTGPFSDVAESLAS